jgi:hypothetical protein
LGLERGDAFLVTRRARLEGVVFLLLGYEDLAQLLDAALLRQDLRLIRARRGGTAPAHVGGNALAGMPPVVARVEKGIF